MAPSSSLAATISALTVLKEAAGVAPLLFLQGAISTALALAQVAQVTKTNKEDFARVSATAFAFVQLVHDKCTKSTVVEVSEFSQATRDFTSVLDEIKEDALKLSQRSLAQRLIHRDDDKTEIINLQRKLDIAIDMFAASRVSYPRATNIKTILDGQRQIIDNQHAQILESLPHASSAWKKIECLPDTREDTLTEIAAWIETTESQVLWLHAAAGTGKSTLAHHVSHTLSRVDRLAGCFFFKRDLAHKNTIEFVVGTLAYHLAKIDRRVKAVICRTASRSPTYQTTGDRFRSLIVEPLLEGVFPHPVVLVLDALDECPNASDFLDIIVDQAASLPLTIKILVTSRHEPEIAHRMTLLSLREIALRPADDGEIRAFIHTNLGNVAKVRCLPEWPAS